MTMSEILSKRFKDPKSKGTQNKVVIKAYLVFLLLKISIYNVKTTYIVDLYGT